MATKTRLGRIISPILCACHQPQLQSLLFAKALGLQRASTARAKTVPPHKQYQLLSISHGWILERRATKPTSRLAQKLSSTAVYVTSSCKGMLGIIRIYFTSLTMDSAAQAWNRSDSRAAKALSLRGQSENNLMREAHREAARILYEERNKDTDSSTELYVDLHGMCLHSLAAYALLTLQQACIRMSQYHILRASS
jgi:hypothetical protein